MKFARLDANGDGALTLQELIEAFDGDEPFAYGALGFHDRDVLLHMSFSISSTQSYV